MVIGAGMPNYKIYLHRFDAKKGHGNWTSVIL